MMITEGLPGKYTAVQMHLHWGGWDLEASGAEHTIDGIRYMAEVGFLEKTEYGDLNKSYSENQLWDQLGPDCCQGPSPLH